MVKSNTEAQVAITKNGPYLVTGSVPLAKQIIAADADGDSEAWTGGYTFPIQQKYALCRCGQSEKKPFCDGTHTKIEFDGTETASRKSYLEQASAFEGPTMILTDAEGFCAFGRFCDPHGKVWDQVARTDEPRVRASFIRQVENCPAGRLVAWDKETQKPLGPKLPISIDLVQDPAEQCSGPLWLRGGIAVISADCIGYEVRNRTTLCRCGASQNKSFCDGSHASIKFQAE